MVGKLVMVNIMSKLIRISMVVSSKHHCVGHWSSPKAKASRSTPGGWLQYWSLSPNWKLKVLLKYIFSNQKMVPVTLGSYHADVCSHGFFDQFGIICSFDDISVAVDSLHLTFIQKASIQVHIYNKYLQSP